ncbi:MAG: hypothetical protein COT38_05045 [Candidatus Omnitrophica bacterium CG08_land_8_20_14_0_20_41_16]|uniref:DUF1015 domain-containing protein n=1 Tax=Candidatus Sherwoodlollariibacterium unditelluris TaxID=1974757 RepID=A0A2G9YKW0_9BACT|nr:MAG: hypothetical protein COX41_00580 [Candidatus Omnitrophica bacterium CG23_combo_of_CG06-09_8_20_14_all_41_10]PIS33499.1 MAG: hypothetical protein COT38_05045 [Candidatus Omnitrophica bacterium CG08_land_8_20_14_0_20_41_16]
MPEIKPFKAVFYNQEKFKDFSNLVCPPYDVISPQQQDYYHNLNPYNFSHILLRKDIPGENKYQCSGAIFKKWLKDKILVSAQKPAIYFYSQQYTIRGERKTRLGFIALLRLGSKSFPVLGHENTRLQAKEDRLKLLKKTNANLSPIFVVSKDNQRVIQRVFEHYVSGKTPFIEVTDIEKTLHRLWSIDDPQALELIKSGMSKESAFIADGHHRYEVSLAYRDELREKLGDKFLEDASFNYTLSYFTSANQRGLSILPIHRLLKLDKEIDLNNFFKSLKEYFDIEGVKNKNRFFFLMEKAGCGGHILGMYKNKRYWLLRLKNMKILDKRMTDKPKEYRSLDVYILNQLVFKGILKYNLEDEDNLKYSPYPDEFIKAADNEPKVLAFFLNPVNINQITTVALGGNKMPPKSSYFYPKVLSGLVINKHEDL